MTGSKKHSEGFTLAELLLSIAIILVLAAIAIPSIVNAQNNMRMVELNNAAESIANAAQTQMTAKKAAGTWLALIDGPDGKVKYPAATGSADSDTYYMVADDLDSLQGARGNGIVPSLSIDDAVRNGDYVIVFKASTASVEAVYYTDGKSGFFGSSPARTNAAQTYYASHGSTDQAARMKNDPMIGYYQGTPAGATDAVALQNPVIWVGSEGKAQGLLFVLDQNIVDHTSWKTVTELSLSKTLDDGSEVSFTIAGMDDDAGKNSLITVTANANGQTVTGSYTSEASGQPVLQRLDRDGNQGKAYALDLNALVRAVKADPLPDGKKLITILDNFNVHDSVRAEAKVEAANLPCVAATATANIEWPQQVGKLSLYISTPWSTVLAGETGEGENNPSYLSESNYNQPEMKATTIEGGSSLTIEGVPTQEDFSLPNSKSNVTLKGINKQNGWQSYLGMNVAYDAAAADQTFVLEGSVGSFTSMTGSRKTHYYQPWELWAQNADKEYVRVGYVRNGDWEWANVNNSNCSSLDDAISWGYEDGPTFDSITDPAIDVSRIVKMQISANNWGDVPDKLSLRDPEGSVSLYLRTAPRTSEVSEYFDKKAENGTLISDLTVGEGQEYNKISARGVNKTVNTSVSQNFEREFGASSADVAWSIARDNDTGFNNGNVFSNDRGAVRVYYSISPGLGFKNIQNNADPFNLRSTQITNASLFMYLKNEHGGLTKQATAQPYKSIPGSYTFTSTTNATDYELKTTEDYRFYRAVSYYEKTKNGDLEIETKLNIPSQYVPYGDQGTKVAQGYDKTIDKVDWEFLGWQTEDTSTGKIEILSSGSLLSSYDKTLSYTGAKLVAKYRIVPKFGLAYLEINKEGKVTACYGYLGEKGAWTDPLPTDNTFTSWGYYAVVEQGTLGDNQQLEVNGNAITVSKTAQEVAIGEVAYDAYLITSSGKSSTQRVEMLATGADEEDKYDFWFNANFACAIAVTNDDANALGSENDPWKVRHATQFPGAIKANGGIQAVYTSGHFKQTHSIDMADAPADAYERKFISTFSGVYDGGGEAGCSIENYWYRLMSEQNHRQGLFPYAEKAILKNIILHGASAAKHTDVWDGQNVNAMFGCLVGEARNCIISKCSIVNDSIGDRYLSISVTNVGTSSSSAMGSLVGLASDTTLSDCSVAGLSLSLESREDTWGNKNYSMGGLVGQCSNSSLSNCEVNKVIMEGLTPTQSSSFLLAGGMVGSFSSSGETEKQMSGCKATSVRFVAKSQKSYAVGGVVGFKDGGSVASSNSFSDAYLYSKTNPSGLLIQTAIGEKVTPK